MAQHLCCRLRRIAPIPSFPHRRGASRDQGCLRQRRKRHSWRDPAAKAVEVCNLS
jgi:hypothetical protein